jgi:hypothetical protein
MDDLIFFGAILRGEMFGYNNKIFLCDSGAS